MSDAITQPYPKLNFLMESALMGYYPWFCMHVIVYGRRKFYPNLVNVCEC